MNEDIAMARALFWNDQAKQRYFNLSRCIIGLTKLKDLERDIEMDAATYASAMDNLKQITSNKK